MAMASFIISKLGRLCNISGGRVAFIEMVMD
jgi:hypothetical protein